MRVNADGFTGGNLQALGFARREVIAALAVARHSCVNAETMWQTFFTVVEIRTRSCA